MPYQHKIKFIYHSGRFLIRYKTDDVYSLLWIILLKTGFSSNWNPCFKQKYTYKFILRAKESERYIKRFLNEQEHLKEFIVFPPSLLYFSSKTAHECMFRKFMIWDVTKRRKNIVCIQYWKVSFYSFFSCLLRGCNYILYFVFLFFLSRTNIVKHNLINLI